MDLETLLDAWYKHQVGERPALADCPACRVMAHCPGRPALGSGVQAQIRRELEQTQAPMTRFASPGAEGTTAARSAPSLDAAKAMLQGIVPAER